MALGQQVARIAGGVLGGCVAWAVAATLLNLALRHSWPDYAAVEKQMDFTLLMMIARLIIGALASVAAGLAAAWISRRNAIATWVVIATMLAIFIPVHVGLWARFPTWYHLFFFTSLALFPLVGLHGMRFRR
ncbi:MAG TPA: hypothetical protein VL199_00275 [Burkholderiales bacterium]|nr:hypothetical protein [Burkholderiales bacterium]